MASLLLYYVDKTSKSYELIIPGVLTVVVDVTNNTSLFLEIKLYPAVSVDYDD
jgi:hypothetical protein